MIISQHYSNEKIDVATLTAWLVLRDKPILHPYHKGFRLIIQLPRLRWFSPDGYLNVHQPAPDGNPNVPLFHVPPAKVYRGLHRSKCTSIISPGFMFPRPFAVREQYIHGCAAHVPMRYLARWRPLRCSSQPMHSLS